MIGKKILHYRILDKLGEGGMGVVYLAEDTKLDRQVAIKFLPGHIAKNSDERKRFEVEAKAAAALNHPNIATIHAIEHVDDEMFIVMEYIEGVELKEKLKSGPLPVDESIKIARQVALGLEAAHEKHIIHRDIKSTNIMITDKVQVKIMDFGLAKVRGGIELTKEQSTIGTAAYMSPEQVRGEEIDNRTDIWSLGVVIYEMLAGQLPFQGDYEAAVLYEILNDEPRALPFYRQDVSNHLTTLVSELLHKDKKKRPDSAGEIIKRLKSRTTDSAPADDMKSIAVLYFENMSPEKENDYFCAGITEDIIIDLSKIHRIRVIPRSDVLPFRTREVNSRKVGEILGVTYILEGSVRKASQQVRVTAQLIDVETGFQMWADRYDRLLEDIFDVQIELSQKIAAALKISLTDAEKESLSQKPTGDLRAHDFYMRGREYLIAGGIRNNVSAIKMFEQALAIDPNYALAYVGLADAYSDQYKYYSGDQKWLGKIINASEKALASDPTLQEANTIKALVLFYQKRFHEARQTLEKFIDQNTDYYPAYYQLGIITQITKEYDAAIRYFTRAAEIKPYSEEPWLHLEMTYRRMGNTQAGDTAMKTLQEVIYRKLQVNDQDATALSRLAAVFAMHQDKDAALNHIVKVLRIEPNDGQVLYNCACSYALLGEREPAFELLQQAIDKGYNNVIEWVANDPDFEQYRGDPQFKKIISNAGK